MNPTNWCQLNKDFQRQVDPDLLKAFADKLGVTPESLKKLGIGRDREGKAWIFSERNAEGEIIGISKRPDTGKKHMVKDSQRGLTMIWPLDAYAGSSPNSPILIVEGATCTAAGIDLDFTTIGRHTAMGGLEHLIPPLRGRHIVIVGENDDAGRMGAIKIANGLVDAAATLKIIYPPEGVKDLRSWKNAPAGCDHDEVMAAIRNAKEFQPDPNAEHAADAAQDIPKRSHADQLVELAGEAKLFHTPGMDGDGYASIQIDDHWETWKINSKGFRQWLSHRFYTKHKKAPGNQALQDAINVLCGHAIHGAPAFEVHVRVAGHCDGIYLDLANKDWQVVEIKSSGWRVIPGDQAPVKFIRRRGMKPPPIPEKGGCLRDLLPFVNVQDDDRWILLCSYLVSALRPGKPCPILNVNGEQGSAKTTLCKMIRELIDPNIASLRRPPRNGPGPDDRRKQRLAGRLRQFEWSVSEFVGQPMRAGHRRRFRYKRVVLRRRREAFRCDAAGDD